MAYRTAKLVSHAQRVLRLYKRCLKAIALSDVHSLTYTYPIDNKHLGLYDGYIVFGEHSKDTPWRRDRSLLIEHHGYLVQLLIRKEFDANKHITDMTQARQLVLETEQRLEKFFIFDETADNFIDSPGGLEFRRYAHIPDWIFDTWHPLERAQYPKYFGTRNQRKLEHMERWNDTYGKPENAPDISKMKEYAKQENLQ